jgi:hypothetical protein|tara:strand:- start:13 stop:699 length:687 start_codon:yes stop_codon:yes gene_type:complete
MVKLKDFYNRDLENKESISLRSIQRRLKEMYEEYDKGILKRKDWKFNNELLSDLDFVFDLLYPRRSYNQEYKWNNFIRCVDVWEKNNEWDYFGVLLPFWNVRDERDVIDKLSELFNTYQLDYIITKERSEDNLLHYHFVIKKGGNGINLTKNRIDTFMKTQYGKDKLMKVSLDNYVKDYSETYRDKGNSVSYILKSLFLFNGINTIGCYNTPQPQSIRVGSKGHLKLG